MDEPDTTERVRRVGTYEAAETETGCNRPVSDDPETSGRLGGC